ncbi:MAG: hypothetical protein A2020_10780 [Lentisphaerae bacterium GWF2_45_14]|nr:MAG: hypothetical protein A2020_10780 [Lentisphaerae bacterium GWF2_45_14]
MNSEKVFQEIMERLSKHELTKIVAAGSTNTDKSALAEGASVWLDWLDVVISGKYGRIHHVINTATSGQTSSEMLEFLESDALSYKPEILIITAGEEDCDLQNNISVEKFTENLKAMVSKARESVPGIIIVLQTSPGFDRKMLADDGEEGKAEAHKAYMDAVREAAKSENCLLSDIDERMELLRGSYPEEYREIMQDSCTLNCTGHMLWGLDLGRLFGGKLPESQELYCEEGLGFQSLLDNLSEEE